MSEPNSLHAYSEVSLTIVNWGYSQENAAKTAASVTAVRQASYPRLKGSTAGEKAKEGLRGLQGGRPRSAPTGVRDAQAGAALLRGGRVGERVHVLVQDGGHGGGGNCWRLRRPPRSTPAAAQGLLRPLPPAARRSADRRHDSRGGTGDWRRFRFPVRILERKARAGWPHFWEQSEPGCAQRRTRAFVLFARLRPASALPEPRREGGVCPPPWRS